MVTTGMDSADVWISPTAEFFHPTNDTVAFAALLGAQGADKKSDTSFFICYALVTRIHRAHHIWASLSIKGTFKAYWES